MRMTLYVVLPGLFTTGNNKQKMLCIVKQTVMSQDNM